MGTTQNQLWPPSEDARSLLVEHMISCLSLESYFSSRHGLMSKEKAGEHAKKIEDIAFAAANHYISRYPNADGSSTTQFYVKETSKLFLDALVRGPPAETEDLNAREAFPEIVEVKETFFDMFTIERGFLDEALATNLFRPLEEFRNSCTKIRFGNQSFGVEAARVAKKVLMDVQKTLTDVEFADFIFNRSQAEALEVMSIFSSALEGCVLRSFSLSLNELEEETIKAFVPLLKSQKMLEELKFNYFYISVEAARAICELLPSIERIKNLHFHYNDSGDDAAETLSVLVKKCIALEDFEFSASEIGTRGAIALAGALSEGSKLKMLNLTDNMFGTKGGIALSQVVSRHLGLTEVYFGHMNLEDEGVIAIADSLKDAAPSLRVLMIGENNITSKAAPALAACLAEKNLLTKFSAAGNKLEDVGSIKICKAISKGHEQLKVLDLSANAMTVIGAKAAAEAVANKRDFSWLFIYENFVTEKEIEIVKDVLRKGTKGDSVLGKEDCYRF